jgi:gliding motility-associated transport system permease protein
MRNVAAIAWREARTYFTSPLAYAVIGMFVLLSGVFFYAALMTFHNYCVRYGSNPYYASQLNVNDFVIRQMFGTMGIILLFMVPIITMRLLAEERRSGTAELLFTCPLTSAQVVIGKFLGAAILLTVMLGVTLSYPLLIMSGGASPEMKPALAGYFGLFLMGLALLAIGLLVSAMTENQIVAAVGAFGVFLILWIVNWLSESATITLTEMVNKATQGLWEKMGLGTGGPTLGDFLSSISLIGHLDDFRKGIIDTQHVIFFVSVAFMALFATQRVLESRRWR